MPELVSQIARVVHEANRAYCVTLGDFSQQPWDKAEEWQRTSAINGVSATLAGRARTPEEQHQLWCDEKVETGWTFGEVKDARLKTHPCLVPYDRLPVEQRMKDVLFRAIVMALCSTRETDKALNEAAGVSPLRQFDALRPTSDEGAVRA